MIFFMTLGLCLATTSMATAQCIIPGAWLLDEPGVEVVFDGSVAGIDRVTDLGIRTTFNVRRVFRGSSPKRFDVYVYELDVEMPRFERGRRYLVFASRMNDESRLRVGLSADDPAAFRPARCGALEYSLARRSGFLRELGKGKAPR